MKKLTKFIIIPLTLISFIACKNSSNAMISNNIDSTSSSTKGGNSQKELVYDVIISFISKGEGIDHKLVEKIDQAISKFNKDKKVSVKPEKLNWGREGELDYNIIFKNLSTTNKKAFISSMQEVVGTSDMAFVNLNQKSVHKR